MLPGYHLQPRPSPHEEDLPGVWGLHPGEGADLEDPSVKYLPSFAKMLVLKAIKPDKLAFAMSNYVGEMMGERFTSVPPLQLKDIFQDTSSSVPVIFGACVATADTAFFKYLRMALLYLTQTGLAGCYGHNWCLQC